MMGEAGYSGTEDVQPFCYALSINEARSNHPSPYQYHPLFKVVTALHTGQSSLLFWDIDRNNIAAHTLTKISTGGGRKAERLYSELE